MSAVDRRIFGIACAALMLTGCLGIGDALAEHRHIGGDYFLSYGEDGGLYLFREGYSVDIAGTIEQMAWNRDFIIINSPSWKSRWMVIRIADGEVLKGFEKEDVEKRLLETMHFMTPQEAWKKARN